MSYNPSEEITMVENIHPKLRERLERFEENENWSGMEIDDMTGVTLYTLRALAAHLSEDVAHGQSEVETIREAIELVETHIEE